MTFDGVLVGSGPAGAARASGTAWIRDLTRPAAPDVPAGVPAPVQPAGSGPAGTQQLPGGGAALPVTGASLPRLVGRPAVLPAGSGRPRAVADDPSFSPD
ncbi:MAG TPA: hypothetical protein VEL73_10485 [Mycobacteriales bacterium]|nr:hypothetical protein [Mycobacteriales bacterium]